MDSLDENKGNKAEFPEMKPVQGNDQPQSYN
jgi:hypothetical protein